MPSSDNSPTDSNPLLNSFTSDLQSRKEVDAIFGCLASQRRRLLIEYLSETSGPVVIEELVQRISERGDKVTSGMPSDERQGDVTITLFHTHLPKMDEVGVIKVDHETKTVQKGDRFCTAESLLEVV